MNFLQRWILGKKLVSELKQFQPGVRYRIEGGVLVSDADNKTSYLSNGYLINDLIYSITGLICNKIRVAEWDLYRVTDESSLKELNALRRKRDLIEGDYKRILQLHKKAFKPVEDSVLSPMLEHPNECSTFQELVADSSLFKMLTGDRYIWAERMSMGANEGKPFALHLLPSHLVSIIANKIMLGGNVAPYMKEVGYQITSWGIQGLRTEDTIHEKYFNPDYSQNGNHLYGLAPLKAALKLTTRSNSANNAATAAFQNGGPKVITFMDDDRFEPKQGVEQVGALKRQLATEYAGADNYNKIAVSGYKVGAVPVGLSPVELAIIESEKWDLRRFCNVFFGIPSQLLNDPENKTYNNQKEGESALTTRCAMPLMNDFRNAFNKKLKEWGFDKSLMVDYDMTCYTELQDDNSQKWGWVKELPVSNKYKLDMMGLDYEEGQEGLEEILIPSTYQRLQDLTMNDVDRALQAGDDGSGDE